MKRTKTFVGSIIGIVVGALSTLIFGIVLSVARTEAFVQSFQEILSQSGITTEDMATLLKMVYGIFVVCVVYGLLLLVFNIIACIISKSSVTTFHRFKAFLIVEIVIGFIGAACFLPSLFTGDFFFALLVVGALVVSPILYIKDLKDEAREYNIYLNTIKYGSNPDLSNQDDRSFNKAPEVTSPQQVPEESVDEKLNRLLNLKEKGLISDEDYARMRETILKSDFK